MRIRRTLLFLVLLFSLFLSGCVYYNTLYNAKKLYKSARSRPLINGKPNTQAIDEYTRAMKKCGYILTEYKNSPYADQALFLLTQSLFYKGNSNLQAYEKCQDFLKFYPKDELVPEVILFEATILHEMKKNDEAVSTLTSFLQEPIFKKYYPRAYLQLSISSMDEKAYAQAQYYLQKIIDNYPHSKEYKEAFFQLGYAFHIENKFADSNQVFQKLLKSRLEKIIKLDARYYIALNDYYQKNYKKADIEIKPLLKAESRADKIPLIKLLKARNLLGLNQYTDAVSLYESINTDYPKTIHSAEANYYLGEFNLNYQHNYEKAITFYNNVKLESNLSPFVEDAFSKSAIASQIILYNKKDSNLAIKEMVNQQMKLAEYYLHSMNLPDSALSVYRGVVNHRGILEAQLDSLDQRIAHLDSLGVPKDTLKVIKLDSLAISGDSLKTSRTDTLNVINDSLRVSQPDSLNVGKKLWNDAKTDSIGIQKDTLSVHKRDSFVNPEETKYKPIRDTLNVPDKTIPVPITYYLQKDSTKAIADSVATDDSSKNQMLGKLVQKQESMQPDSIDFKIKDNMTSSSDSTGLKIISLADSTKSDSTGFQDSLQVTKNKHIKTPEMQSLLAKQNQLSVNLMEYDSDYVPLALYDQIWIYKYSIPDSVKMEQVYQEMQDKYPLNRYTHAATLMLQGKKVEVTTDEEIAIEKEYTDAMDLYSSSPDSAKTILKTLTSNKNSIFNDKSKYSLGYIFWFNEHDSVNAKPYFDDLLKKDANSEYSTYINQFYNGSNFVFIDELPAIREMEEREKQKKITEQANELKKQELNRLVDNPKPKGAVLEYILPPLPEKPIIIEDTTSVKDTTRAIEEKPKQEETKNIPQISQPMNTGVNQPQIKENDRPFDFIKPIPSVKPKDSE